MPESFGICIQPSARSAAYVRVLDRLGLVPDWVMLMPDAYGVREALVDESARHGYARDYFDPDVDFTVWAAERGARIVCVKYGDINDPDVVEALYGSGCDWIIYTGGGIARDRVLGASPPLLHVHPGLTPTWRGSTCFYYSLLAGQGLGATAFFLARDIDEGPVVGQAAFHANCFVGRDQPLFMDHVLDPWLRASLLETVLEGFTARGRLESAPQARPSGPACYVMHPALRSLAVMRLNKSFDPDSPPGIRAIDAGTSHGQ